MELTQVNSTQQLNTNNLNFLRSEKVENTDNQSIQNTNKLDRVEYLNTKQNSFSLNLTSSISSISNIQMAKNDVSSALHIVNEFERVVTSNKNSLDNIQPQIQSFINTFNSSAKGLSDTISKISQEMQSDESRVYFDGILGAKPISGQEIYEAISKQKQNLEQYNKALNNQLIETTTQTKEMFSVEKSSFSDTQQKIDFKIESENFEAKRVETQNGSITQTQANAEPSISKELLVAS